MEKESGNSSGKKKMPMNSSYEGSNLTLKQYVRDTKKVTRWYPLGIQLGIKTPDLKEIEKNCSGDTERCRIEVIDYWLNNDPEPTRSKLAQAVEDMGGHANVVQTLRANHEGVPQTLKDSGCISCKVLAVEKDGNGGLSEQSSSTKTSDESSGYQSASQPEPSHEQPNSSDERSDSSDEPTTPVDCMCGKCDLYTLCTRGCSNQGGGIPLPIWNGTGKTFQTDYWQLIDYERELTKATKKIVKAFAHLVTETSKSFAQNSKVGLDEVVLWLRQMEVYMPLTNASVSLSETMEVDDFKDMQQLFKNLSKYWSWYNYDLLEDLINEFGNKEDEKNLSIYRNEYYALYLKNGLPKSQDSFSFGTRCQKHQKKLLIKIDKYWNTIPLEQIRELHHKIAEILKVQPKVLYLSSVSKGCICLEFLVPESMAILLCASQKEALMAVDVFRLECGEYVWQDPDYLGHADRPEEEDDGYEGCSEGESDIDLTSHSQAGKHTRKKGSATRTHGRVVKGSSKLPNLTESMSSEGPSEGPDVVAGTVQLHSSEDDERHEHVQELQNVVAKEDEQLTKGSSTREVQDVVFLDHDHSSTADEHSAETESQMPLDTGQSVKQDMEFGQLLQLSGSSGSIAAGSVHPFHQVRTRQGHTTAGKTGPGPGLGPGDLASLGSRLHTMASKTGLGPDPGPVPGELVVLKKETRTLIPKPHDEHHAYCQFLKDKYKRMFTLLDGDWAPSFGRQYTRIAMIKQERVLPGAELVAMMNRDHVHGNIVKKKKAIQLAEMFLSTKSDGHQLKIFIEGVPEVDKSTLSRKVYKDWAEFLHLVMVLALRQASIRTGTMIATIEWEERLPGPKLVAIMRRDYIHGDEHAAEVPLQNMITEDEQLKKETTVDHTTAVQHDYDHPASSGSTADPKVDQRPLDTGESVKKGVESGQLLQLSGSNGSIAAGSVHPFHQVSLSYNHLSETGTIALALECNTRLEDLKEICLPTLKNIFHDQNMLTKNKGIILSSHGPVSLITGPFGTGKTRLLGGIVRLLIEKSSQPAWMQIYQTCDNQGDRDRDVQTILHRQSAQEDEQGDEDASKVPDLTLIPVQLKDRFETCFQMIKSVFMVHNGKEIHSQKYSGREVRDPLIEMVAQALTQSEVENSLEIIHLMSGRQPLNPVLPCQMMTPSSPSPSIPLNKGSQSKSSGGGQVNYVISFQSSLAAGLGRYMGGDDDPWCNCHPIDYVCDPFVGMVAQTPIQCTKESSIEIEIPGEELAYNFLHLTVQEFLVAFQLSGGKPIDEWLAKNEDQAHKDHLSLLFSAPNLRVGMLLDFPVLMQKQFGFQCKSLELHLKDMQLMLRIYGRLLNHLPRKRTSEFTHIKYRKQEHMNCVASHSLFNLLSSFRSGQGNGMSRDLDNMLQLSHLDVLDLCNNKMKGDNCHVIVLSKGLHLSEGGQLAFKEILEHPSYSRIEEEPELAVLKRELAALEKKFASMEENENCISDKWEEIGQMLKLNLKAENISLQVWHGSLESFRTSISFANLISNWLSGKESPYTWEQVSRVVYQPAVEGDMLVDELKKK